MDIVALSKNILKLNSLDLLLIENYKILIIIRKLFRKKNIMTSALIEFEFFLIKNIRESVKFSEKKKFFSWIIISVKNYSIQYEPLGEIFILFLFD